MDNLLGPLLLFSVFIVFFIVLPQRKKMKQEKKFYSELKRGTKVITNGGLHGKVLDINDDGTIIIETGAGKMKFERTAISVEMSNKLNAPKNK
ncbi:MAG: preprotein translocase subunit YajC [Bacteroidetes bacterium]|nr:preprotein translocase subunit YajC [Bacteroidota bacterium]TDI67502.1 MAG: preprotein translocase subunit YajC [Bacteroidota bacterium]TDI76073.1 MAG: preprotein translocase subunit YajC [Bacteroidota bacterium]TDI80274.1 MAG: preprotein translocase subunit YajC [Bacteroidota bacterium]